MKIPMIKFLCLKDCPNDHFLAHPTHVSNQRSPKLRCLDNRGRHRVSARIPHWTRSRVAAGVSMSWAMRMGWFIPPFPTFFFPHQFQHFYQLVFVIVDTLLLMVLSLLSGIFLWYQISDQFFAWVTSRLPGSSMCYTCGPLQDLTVSDAWAIGPCPFEKMNVSQHCRASQSVGDWIYPRDYA